MAHSLIVLPDDSARPILSAIDGASRTLRVKMFVFSDPGLLKAVASAKRRGVKVRVMLEPKTVEAGNFDTLAPKLTATVGSANTASVASKGGGGGGGGALRALTNTAHTVSVTLTAPVTVTVIVAAVVLAVAGGLIAGSFGGWRAARLRPAAALARVE